MQTCQLKYLCRHDFLFIYELSKPPTPSTPAADFYGSIWNKHTTRARSCSQILAKTA